METTLPFPRLEIRWTKKRGSALLAEYFLVIAPPSVGDLRCNVYDKKTDTEKYSARNVEYVLGTTKRDGGGEPFGSDEKINTPFRDGSHILWDMDKLKLPAYATYAGYASEIRFHGGQVHHLRKFKVVS